MPGHRVAQHSLHAKEARNYARACKALSEESAEAFFCQCRWGSATEQACPQCGVFRKHYRRQKRRRWRCAECAHEFSATSGTVFHGHKLSYREILEMVLVFESGAKGRSFLEISRLIGCTPKTAQANFGKIREVLVNQMDLSQLQGIIHMDGVYLGGKPRKANRRRPMPKDAIKVRYGRKPPANPHAPWVSAGMTRRNWQKRANKRVVISLCEAGELGTGSRRVMAFVCPAEDDATVMALAKRFIGDGSVVMSDESPAYTRLSTSHERYTVRHSREYATHEGVNNNMAETWNSRIRRYEYGVGHGFRPKYVQDYVCEFVWRENMRCKSQKDRIHGLLTRLMRSPPSAWWRGYWQGRHRSGEIGMNYFLDRLARDQATS